MTTPMMQQLHAAKREHPDGLLFFRMGDFFELFGDDAVLGAELLGLTLTSREKGEGALPMAGVPVRSAEGYINRLVRMGRKVVVCDQIQDPSEAKGLVERAVTRVVTPGTVLDEEGLDEKSHNYLLGVFLRGDRVGLAYADLSTGTFLLEDVDRVHVLEGIAGVDPAECLIPESALEPQSPYASWTSTLLCPMTRLPDWRFDEDEAARNLCVHFKVARLDGFGIEEASPAVGAAGAVLHYLQETQKGALGHFTRLSRVRRDGFMVLDRTTRSSLELIRTQRDGGRRGSLLWVLDRTLTPMGGRLLKDWVLQPLREVEAIRTRQDAVEELLEDTRRDGLRLRLKQVRDVERLLARVACGRATARELVGLRGSICVLPEIQFHLEESTSPLLGDLRRRLPDLSDLSDLLQRALNDEVPQTVKEGGLIRAGYDPELDALRAMGSDSRDWIARFQRAEQERTRIPSLKVGFNRVFGYYIEITNTHGARAPDHYIRKQTLKNAERYITPELKEYEEKVLGADEKIKEREYEHFLRLRDEVKQRLVDIQVASDVVACVDALQSLSQAARDHRFVRPDVDTSGDMEVWEGRHPVLDRIQMDPPFVPNDLQFLEGTRELILITGPNMAGKSTYIRQAALIAIMAQVGSFVPARQARIGLVDRVFTRIGASDELQRGNSTFMVEMIETAEILNTATRQSLVILDEVGRGTSTFDGLAIAWAITEHLARVIGCRTLFATHYHQLLDLAEELPNACNMNVAVREWGEEIVFLHKIVEGGTSRSYGIHVGRLAGIPRTVLDRATRVLAQVEGEHPVGTNERQLSLFAEPEDPVHRALREADLDHLTPMDALLFLRRLQQGLRSPT
jgi:DNA mismatch repair protein MutS